MDKFQSGMVQQAYLSVGSRGNKFGTMGEKFGFGEHHELG